MHNNYICFTNLPRIDELLYVFATINISENVNTSYYNLVIKKCRQLIFENSEVLASPHLDNIYGINIIVKESIYESGKIQKYLSNHNLKTGAPTVVSKYTYEDCCIYTIIANLAPKWNLVSNYLIRGRDFLTTIGQKDCVLLSLCINDNGETSMIFEISRIILHTMSLDKLDLPDNYIRELNEKTSVTFKYCNSKTIRVLPSLKRGNILSIHRNINESSSLQNYKQFRRHWKNTYGYRLPESEKDIFYLEISFFDGSPVFSYPSVCVRPYEPTFVQRVEPGPIVSKFIADFMQSMPTVLGDKYPVPSHINQPKPLLFPGTENLQYSNVCAIDLKSVSDVSDTQNSAVVYLPTQKPDNIENNLESKSKLSQLLSQLNKPENKTSIYLTQRTSISPGISQTPQSVLTERLNENNIDNENRNFLSKPSPKLSLISQEIQNQAQFLSQKVAQRINMTPKKIPKFSKPNSQNTTTDTNQTINTAEKYVPVFTSKFPKIKNLKYIPKSAIKPVQKEIKFQETEAKKPIQKDIKPQKTIATKPVQNEIKSQEITVTKPYHKQMKSQEDNDLNDFQPSVKKIMKDPIIPIFNMARAQDNENNNEKPKKQNSNNTGRKRANVDNSSEVTDAKKPREKPVVTEVNNMKELVNNGTINKLNIQSLMKWLKERNIHCTTKDKKSALVEKVINNISKE